MRIFLKRQFNKVKEHMHFSKRLISLVVFLLLSQMSIPVFSQAMHADIDKLKITLFIVSETVVNKPITREDISRWKETGKNWQTFTLSGGGQLQQPLKLDEKLFEILDVYAGRLVNAKDQLSVVLFFEWDKPRTFKVSLDRIVSKHIYPILSDNWSEPLKNQQYWSHHERADAFLPANNIKWTFKAGNQVWKFYMR